MVMSVRVFRGFGRAAGQLMVAVRCGSAGGTVVIVIRPSVVPRSSGLVHVVGIIALFWRVRVIVMLRCVVPMRYPVRHGEAGRREAGDKRQHEHGPTGPGGVEHMGNVAPGPPSSRELSAGRRIGP